MYHLVLWSYLELALVHAAEANRNFTIIKARTHNMGNLDNLSYSWNFMWATWVVSDSQKYLWPNIHKFLLIQCLYSKRGTSIFGDIIALYTIKCTAKYFVIAVDPKGWSFKKVGETLDIIHFKWKLRFIISVTIVYYRKTQLRDIVRAGSGQWLVGSDVVGSG